MVDILVVGGGPAGMTAALYALRNGKSVLVIEKNGFGGQITYSPKVENYPGTMQMSGNEFADHLLEQILAHGAEIEFEKVTSVTVLPNGTKKVETEEGGVYEAAAVVLATGVKHRMLGLDGEQELVGEGISFCAVCDGDFYAGQTVCVAGGGNSALQEALLLSEKCEQVIILQDLPRFTGEKRLQDVLFSRPNVKAYVNQTITGFQTENGALRGVVSRDRETGEERVIPAAGLFEAIGLIPENKPFASLCTLNEYGYFDADENCSTKTPGIFVAGDCRSKRIRQLTTAAADGSAAALGACRYLDEQGKR
ncbi:MAG: FAD-dependent oxidoreductase [Clostridia bacterium]|nr:FAD-dependent oxidoreductase [Clostridia bacterium]